MSTDIDVKIIKSLYHDFQNCQPPPLCDFFTLWSIFSRPASGRVTTNQHFTLPSSLTMGNAAQVVSLPGSLETGEFPSSLTRGTA